MAGLSETLLALDEPFAAGYYEMPNASPVLRWSRAVRRELEQRMVAPYEGEALFPTGFSAMRDSAASARIVIPNLVSTWQFQSAAFERKYAAADGQSRAALETLREDLEILRRDLNVISGDHVVGGAGYIHCVPNYPRVIADGLDSYRERISIRKNEAFREGDRAVVELEEGLLDVLSGIASWHARMVEALKVWVPVDIQTGLDRDRLVRALNRVPWKPAETFVDAAACYNFVFYLDYCDNPGRIDQILYPFFSRDLETGLIDEEDASRYVRAFTENCCDNDSWSAAIGGTGPDGSAAYNRITTMSLETVIGHHRPNYQLRMRDDMPDEVWGAACAAIESGCGQPALYNESGYYESLKKVEPALDAEALAAWNGGGCTETMIQGLSNVGSLDSGINLLLILERIVQQYLASVDEFEQLITAFEDEVRRVVEEITSHLNAMFEARSRLNPHPIRSLLVDDCIDKGLDFQAGGARYNWSVNNVAGVANVADSLMAIKRAVFDETAVSGQALVDTLKSDFGNMEHLRAKLASYPRFGNDCDEVDLIASRISKTVFEAFRDKKTFRGGVFVPSCIMFTTYGSAGRRVGATPDGRRDGEPVADSIGPMYGRDENGPTAMLKSVTKLPLSLAAGTPIVNIRIKKGLLSSSNGSKKFRELVETYFNMGGLQLQVNVFDEEVLRDAMLHPDEHENLIVRIGGFSVRFNDLTEDLKETMLLRTEHGV